MHHLLSPTTIKKSWAFTILFQSLVLIISEITTNIHIYSVVASPDNSLALEGGSNWVILIPRGAIARNPDTKLLREDGEDTEIDWGTKSNPEAKPSEKIPETLRLIVGGTDPTPRRIALGSKSKVGTITDLEMGEKLDPSLYPPRRSRPMEHQDNQHKRSLAFVDARGGVTQERCIPIPWWAGARPVAVGIWQIDILMGMGM